MSDGTVGISTTLSGGTSSSVVGNIISIGGPNQTRTSVDKSTMDSTAKYKEFMPGMIDAGELTVEINYDGTAAGTADYLNATFQNTATSNISTWTITAPDAVAGVSSASSWAGSGFISALGNAIPMDDKITQSLTIKLSGKLTFTDAAVL